MSEELMLNLQWAELKLEKENEEWSGKQKVPYPLGWQESCWVVWILFQECKPQQQPKAQKP